MRTRRRSVLLYTLTILILYGLLEISSFLGLKIAGRIRPNLILETFVQNHFDSIDDEYRISFINKAYDRELGWDNYPFSRHTATNTVGDEYSDSYGHDGSRDDGLPPKDLLIATYGDSFTEGGEVNNDETWQYFLGQSMGYDVKNFGVSAYGPGQALLKLKRHIDQGFVAPITILGIHEGNIGRTVNLFRPFFYPSTGAKLGFKPGLRLAECNSSRTPMTTRTNRWAIYVTLQLSLPKVISGDREKRQSIFLIQLSLFA